MKKAYTAPYVSMEEIEQDSLMIQFSLQVGGDDEDEAGAKRSHFIFDDSFLDEEDMSSIFLDPFKTEGEIQ